MDGNSVLRTAFENRLPRLRAEWEASTGQTWPTVTVIRNGSPVQQAAQAHHIIPVTNNGTTAWWNITPATQTQHTAIHQGALNTLQQGVK